MKVAKLILAFSAILYTIPSHALTVGEYLSTKKDSQEAALQYVLLTGVGNGFVIANAYLDSVGKPSLFCTPESIELNTDNYRSLIDNELKSGNYKNNDDVQIILIKQLVKIFPCKQVQ